MTRIVSDISFPLFSGDDCESLNFDVNFYLKIKTVRSLLIDTIDVVAIEGASRDYDLSLLGRQEKSFVACRRREISCKIAELSGACSRD